MFTRFNSSVTGIVAAIILVLIIVLLDVSQAQPWEIGDTTSFWTYDFHFFRKYDKTRMTLQAEGEHCYLWTEDSCWTTGRIDQADVQAILAAFEDYTPAANVTAEGILSDTSGIYEKLTGIYGGPQDIDNDPRIYILILNCTEGIGATAMPGYFDPIHQLPQSEHRFSNEHEMIFVDCDPFDPSSLEGLRSVAQQFAHLLQHGNDPEEECWITEGLTYLAQFFCGYGVANPGLYSREPLLWYLYSTLSTTDCREQPELQDQVKTAMFMQYLFEQYGINIIQDLATDTEHRGMMAITTALAENGYSDVDFDSLFLDEQMAWFLDADQQWFFDGKYAFQYYESGDMLDAKTYMTWCLLDDPPYHFFGNQWSVNWILVNPPAPCLGDTIIFQGESDHNFRVAAIKVNLPWQMAFDADYFVAMEFPSLDAENRAVLDVSGYGLDYTMVYVAVMNKDARDGTSSPTRFTIDSNYDFPVRFDPPLGLRAKDGEVHKVPLEWNPPDLSPRTTGESMLDADRKKLNINSLREVKDRFYRKAVKSVTDDSPETIPVEYNVYRSDTPGGPYDMIAAIYVEAYTNVIAYVDTAVVGDHTYHYVVTAVYADPPGESEYSNEASATPRAVDEAATLWTSVSDNGFYGNSDFQYMNFEWPGGTDNGYGWDGRFWAGTVVDGVDRVSHADYGDHEFYPPDGCCNEQYYDIGINTFEVNLTFTDEHNRLGHYPLGLYVMQRALMWPNSFPAYDDFLALEIAVVNSSSRDYEHFFVAWNFDADVCHRDHTDPHIDDLVDYDGWDGPDSKTDELPEIYPGTPFDRGDIVDPFDWDGDGQTGYDEWGVPYGDPDNPDFDESLIEPDGFPDEYTLLIEETRGQRLAFKHPDVEDSIVVHGFALPRNMSYIYDGDHLNTPEQDFQERGQTPFPCDGYIGGRLIYAPNRLHAPGVYYNYSGSDYARSDSLLMPFCHSWWNWEDDPGNDAEKFDFMNGQHTAMRGKQYMVNPHHPDYNAPVFDYRWLQSAGPFDFPVGDTLKLVYVVGVGRGLQGLRENLDNALKGYYQGSIYSDPYHPSTFDADVHWRIESVAVSRGDINGDSVIDVRDVLIAVNHIVGKRTLRGDGLWRADCNGDGFIDALDVVGMVNVILGRGGCLPGTCQTAVTPEVMTFLQSLKSYLREEDFNIFMSSCNVEVSTPFEYKLGKNHPNPFNPESKIRYQLAESKHPQHTTLKIFNILGQEVRTLVDEVKGAGQYTVTWDGRDQLGREVASGVYFYRLSVDNGQWSETKKMVLLR